MVYHPKWLCFANGDPTNYWKTIKLPFYKEIELMLNPQIYRNYILGRANFGDKIHIATEGPLGLYAKRILDEEGFSYTTSFHTKFPDYIQNMFKIPKKLSYRYFKYFHKKSKKILVPTRSIKDELENYGFSNMQLWTRGVDSNYFNYKKRGNTEKCVLCVSRASREKGLDDFCSLNTSTYKKILIGDGPYLNTLRKKYKDVLFLGKKENYELGEFYANADLFVFPSKTDTFGIVLLESIACGTPLLTYYEPGPKEVIEQGVNGIMTDNLQKDFNNAISLDRKKVYESSKKWTWEKCTSMFLNSL